MPPGTRRVRVTLTSTDDDKTYSSALADNVRLTLDAPAVEQPAAAQALAPGYPHPAQARAPAGSGRGGRSGCG